MSINNYEQYLVIEDNHIKISQITNIKLVERVNQEKITIFVPSRIFTFTGDSARKYMVSLKAFLRVQGEVILIPHADKRTEEEK